MAKTRNVSTGRLLLELGINVAVILAIVGAVVWLMRACSDVI